MVDQVGVHGGDGVGAHFSGVEQCASIHACPTCSAVVRGRYGAEIQQAVTQHMAAGGTVLFVTATLRHDLTMPLRTTLNAAVEGWRRTFSGRPWQKKRDALGVVGMIRSVEVTYNEHGGGWHPHVHALLFLEKRCRAKEVAEFSGWFYDRWAKRVENLGAGLPDREHGVRVEVVKGAKDAATYIAKVQDEGARNLGAELARGDLKTSSMHPFELLDAGHGHAKYRALWIEYVRATKGRQAITWTAGLRERFDLEPEKTAEEIIDEAEQAEHRFSIDGERWDAIRPETDRLALILNAVECDRFDLAERLVFAARLDEFWVDPDTGEVLHVGRSAPPKM